MGKEDFVHASDSTAHDYEETFLRADTFSSSRPMKAWIGAIVPFHTGFLIDSVAYAFRAPDGTEQRIRQPSCTIEHASIVRWTGEVDFVGWAERLPQAGEPVENVERFNAAHRPFGVENFDRMRERSPLYACVPRRTRRGRLTIDKAYDRHPNNITFSGSPPCPVAMDLMTYLDVPVTG